MLPAKRFSKFRVTEISRTVSAIGKGAYPFGMEKTPYVEILHSIFPVHVMQGSALTQRYGEESTAIEATRLGYSRKKRM